MLVSLLGKANLTVDSRRGRVRVADPNQEVHIPTAIQWDVLDLSGCQKAIIFPEVFESYELHLRDSAVTEIPQGIKVKSILDCTGCRELRSLPTNLKVGTLRLSGCVSLQALPEGLDCWFLRMNGCWGFKSWPQVGAIRNGDLDLRGCTAMTCLPDLLEPLASLNVRDCSNLTALPDSLRITGWIDIAQSGLAHLKEIPRSLQDVEIRWQGVRIDQRIWLQPETIQLEEILEQQNAELRRVLIDRFGQSRFMAESNAEVLDEDQDSGGLRQLLRVALPNDEPLVTLACKCPSTSRQYYLRVPPNMASCRQAAAWMAGFDDPDDYQPVVET